MKKLLKVLSLAILLIVINTSFNSNKRVIVIDAGHGGEDMGAMREDAIEKDIVLKIATIIKEYNSDPSIEIVLTRSGDESPSLSERTEFINKINPEMVISLHINSTPKETDKRGAEIFVQDNDTSKAIAEKLAEKFELVEIKKHDLHLLRESKAPAVLLEIGFMSNKEDRNYFISEEGQTDIAKKVLEFIYETRI